MARIRSVSPDICVSETMAGLPAELERTFVRLWTHCDDHGRALDNTKLIKAAIFPLTDEMTAEAIDTHLDYLVNHGLIQRYEDGGKQYLSVRSWAEYQHPQRPTPSKYPEPPEYVEEASRAPRGGCIDDSRPGGERERERELGEGEGVLALDEPARNGHGAVPAKKTRAKDPIWDALLAVCGVQQVTETARGGYNKAAGDLRKLGVTAEEIGRRALVYRQKWPDVSLTPNGLVKQWGVCDPDMQHASVTPRDRDIETLRASARGLSR